jgi:hypothetical protein
VEKPWEAIIIRRSPTPRPTSFSPLGAHNARSTPRSCSGASASDFAPLDSHAEHGVGAHIREWFATRPPVFAMSKPGGTMGSSLIGPGCSSSSLVKSRERARITYLELTLKICSEVESALERLLAPG